jgi:hypothetical protein
MNIEIYQGKAKKTGNEFEAIKLTIGDWSTLVFPKTQFEMDYIKQYLKDNK